MPRIAGREIDRPDLPFSFTESDDRLPRWPSVSAVLPSAAATSAHDHPLTIRRPASTPRLPSILGVEQLAGLLEARGECLLEVDEDVPEPPGSVERQYFPHDRLFLELRARHPGESWVSEARGISTGLLDFGVPVDPKWTAKAVFREALRSMPAQGWTSLPLPVIDPEALRSQTPADRRVVTQFVTAATRAAFERSIADPQVLDEIRSVLQVKQHPQAFLSGCDCACELVSPHTAMPDRFRDPVQVVPLVDRALFSAALSFLHAEYPERKLVPNNQLDLAEWAYMLLRNPDHLAVAAQWLQVAHGFRPFDPRNPPPCLQAFMQPGQGCVPPEREILDDPKFAQASWDSGVNGVKLGHFVLYSVYVADKPWLPKEPYNTLLNFPVDKDVPPPPLPERGISDPFLASMPPAKAMANFKEMASHSPPEGGVRMCVHASHPPGRSLNCAHQSPGMSYPNVGMATAPLQQGDLQHQRDVSAAYRTLPMASDLAPWTAQRLHGRHRLVEGVLVSDDWGVEHVYVDTRLPFGLAGACTAYQGKSNCVSQDAIRVGYDRQIALLDDHHGSGLPSGPFSAARAAEYVSLKLNLLGQPTKAEKNQDGPATAFLGQLVDNGENALCITTPRLAKHAGLFVQLRPVLTRRSRTPGSKPIWVVERRRMETVFHTLLFSTPAIDGGRLHLCAIAAALRSKKGGKYVVLTTIIWEEIRFWEFWVPQLHGMAIRPLSRSELTNEHFRCDACPEGFGIFIDGEVVWGRWTPAQKALFFSLMGKGCIALMELFTQVLAKIMLLLLFPQFRGWLIHQGCDNMNAIYWHNLSKPKSVAAAGMLKSVYWCSRRYDTPSVFEYINTHAMDIADPASRLGLDGDASERLTVGLARWSLANGGRATRIRRFEEVFPEDVFSLVSTAPATLLLDPSDRARWLPSVPVPHL